MLKINGINDINLSFEIMTNNYVHDVYEIEKECFAEPWTKNSIIETINNENTHLILANLNFNVVGYAGMYFICDEGYIYNIAVRREYRNLGIGKKLLSKLEDYSIKNKLKFLSLEVRRTNYKAISLYKKAGFIEVGVRKNFYSLPKEDAIIMTKYFKNNGDVS